MKYILKGREVDVESFEYSVDDSGYPEVISAEYSDGSDYLTQEEIYEVIGNYGLPDEAYEIINNTSEALTLRERNS